MKAKTLARLALFTALASVLLILTAFVPSGRVALCAVAGLFTAAAILEGKLWYGPAVYMAASVLSFIIAPKKEYVLLYVLLLGYYPYIKALAERFKSRVLEWLVKLLLCAAALTAVLFLLRELFVGFLSFKLAYPLVYLVVLAVFVVYDIGLSGLIRFYTSRIRRHFK